jgi:hypothetical protein
MTLRHILMFTSPKKRAPSPKMLALNIGENDPVANQLVAIEMGEVAKMKFKKPKAERRDSIRRIFGKMVHVDADNQVAAAKAAKLLDGRANRRSMLTNSPSALALDSGENAPPLLISLKSVTPRKASFTPGAYPAPASETDDDDALMD